MSAESLLDATASNTTSAVAPAQLLSPATTPTVNTSTKTMPRTGSGSVAEFVAAHGGNKVIEKVLICNNGIAAVKGIRSIRKWAYETFGNERAIEFTVMATPQDLNANADYIRMADSYVEVPGGSNNNNYANVELIVELAERLGVHGVWAGWGHASENPKLPDSLTAAGIAFLGPPGSAMRALGDKISSTIVAQSADVPCMPWSGDGLTVNTVDQTDGKVADVPADVYQKACVADAESGLASALRIGFPVMVKASEGGGGKGIRKVDSPDQFASLFNQVQGEVSGSPIFVMKLAGNARHLEVQLLADQYGQAISIFGRDCSVQRRHQKIIEEAPVTVCSPEKCNQLEQAAVRLAHLVGYVSVGTVEYLYNYEDDSFYFLELNPRLQVEHPTTEMVSGVNLPAAQLQVAMGIPLHRIRDIRVLYGLDPRGSSEIDFSFKDPDSFKTQQKPRPKGHVIAVRITAENPEAGFKPSSGSMQELNFRSSNNVWGYFSVGVSGGLHEFADSQFGHIFAYGENRQQARRNMVVALKEISIRGDFRTTVEYLIRLLETDAFEKNLFNTGWLDMLIRDKLTAERPDPVVAVVCGALYRADQMSQQRLDEFKRMLSKGQSPSHELLRTDFTVEIIYENVKYSFTSTQSGPHGYTLFINGSVVEVNARKLSDGALLIQLDGKSHVTYAKEDVASTRLLIDGKTCTLEKENDPTKLRSPSPGKLVRFVVEDGDHVTAGLPYAEIEVMKMYMSLAVTETGTVRFLKPAGSVLEAGDIIGIMTLDDPSRVRHAQPFDGQLPKMGPPIAVPAKSNHMLRSATRTLELVLAGYDNQSRVSECLKQMYDALRNPNLPYLELQEHMAALSSRMPSKLVDRFQAILKAFASPGGFPARELQEAVQLHLDAVLKPTEKAAIIDTIAPINDTLERYREGLLVHEKMVIRSLLQSYLTVEKQFGVEGKRQEDVIQEIRTSIKDDLDSVVAIALSHSKLSSKNNLVLSLLEHMSAHRESRGEDKFYGPVLKQLAELQGARFAKVALKARAILVESMLPSYEDRRSEMERVLLSAVSDGNESDDSDSLSSSNSNSNNQSDGGLKFSMGSRNNSQASLSQNPSHLPEFGKLREIIDSNLTLDDVLTPFFYHADKNVIAAALEVYIRRAYRAYTLNDISHHVEKEEARELFQQGVYFCDFHFLLPTEKAVFDEKAAPMLRRDFSVSDALFTREKERKITKEPWRVGIFAAVQSFSQLKIMFSQLIDIIPYREGDTDELPSEPTDVVNIALRMSKEDTEDDQKILKKLTPFVQEVKNLLRGRWVRRITFMIPRHEALPAFFTFRERSDYSEDPVIRHVEPALAFQLELFRMANFDIKALLVDNRSLHLYYGTGKQNPSDGRFFVRALIRPGLMQADEVPTDYLVSEADRVISESLDALELKFAMYPNSDCNQIFMNFIPTVRVSIADIKDTFRGFIERHGKRMQRLRVAMGEIKLTIRYSANAPPMIVRFVISNVTGFVLNVHIYKEIKNEKRQEVFVSVADRGPLHNLPVDTPYPTKEWLQPKRYSAHTAGTTYIYDFPELFRQVVSVQWQRATARDPTLAVPPVLLKAKELVLDEKDKLHEVYRPAGSNTIGMVAWIVELFTPEYPKGRRVVLIGNDITHIIGSFGPAEDRLFYKASEMARRLGIPRIYISANSGARIGIAEEVMALFRVAWNNKENPAKGFKYLYVTPDDYQLLTQGGKASVKADLVKDEESGEDRYMITDVIGAADGIGVENLQGSGLIAGETSRSYKETFTITLVTCRSVGIGAYLVRLGQRAIQNEGNPIILTGAGALNKVLGREVYTSNLQLGGTQIMFNNGVSHLTSKDDFQGVTEILNWLGYVPKERGAPLPVVLPTIDDPVDRDVEWTPPANKTPYDPRQLIAGGFSEDKKWLPGLFDRDSFMETLGGWAKSVVTGRARLGGIPMGVIAVETRTMEAVIPADPANMDSQQQTLQQAGQVWFPDSAYKTAQAINDFNNGEELPLMILANWRGFSGGQRDMFEEVLKYGALIVDALREYRQPLFIYLPPRAELRGGAWVVLDSTINSDGHIEMYADPLSRGGVLEPEGTVEIKFRKATLLSTMTRVDDVYRKLKEKLQADADKIRVLSAEERAEAKTAVEKREKELLPMYYQVALHFADLHDTAGRMKEKGVIRQVVEWRNARRVFHKRLLRRLEEETLLKQILHVQISESTRAMGQSVVREWMAADVPDAKYDDDDAALEWMRRFRSAVSTRLQSMEREQVTANILKEAEKDKSAAINALLSLVKSMDPKDRDELALRMKSL